MADGNLIIGCSGLLSERSGIGVVQRRVYPFLEQRGHKLVFSAPRDGAKSPLKSVRGTVRGFMPAAKPYDVYLSVVAPLPFRTAVPTLTIVHDLRWLRTRGRVSRRYREWDLRRTVARSEAVLCISGRTHGDVQEFFGKPVPHSTWEWLGPGLVREPYFGGDRMGRLLLIGGAPHKENEAAAELLAQVRPGWVTHITGIGVSDAARRTLEDAYDPTNLTFVSGLTDEEMIYHYRQSYAFMLLGTDEGFGLPFIEAMQSGCQVIAQEHALISELLGGAVVTLPPNPSGARDRLGVMPAVPLALRQEQAMRFSWVNFCERVESELISLAAISNEKN